MKKGLRVGLSKLRIATTMASTFSSRPKLLKSFNDKVYIFTRIVEGLLFVRYLFDYIAVEFITGKHLQ